MHGQLSANVPRSDIVRPGIVDALRAAIRAGATPVDLGRSLAYGAALRVARFGNANEHADWDTAHHVFTYANAIHQMLKRIGTADTDSYVTAVRGILHGAMALYLTRYLNVPPARMPSEDGEQLDDLPADAETICAALLDAFDRQRQVDHVARPRIDPLFPVREPSRVSTGSVTFEPGARTAWHTHPLGQTLIITSGLGWVQREGGPIEDVRPGDVVWSIGPIHQRKAEDAVVTLLSSASGQADASDVFKALAGALESEQDINPSSQIYDLIVHYVADVAMVWRQVGLRPARARHPEDPTYKSKFHRFVDLVLVAMIEPEARRHLVDLDDMRRKVRRAHTALPDELRRITSPTLRRADIVWLVNDDHLKKALRIR